MYQQNSMASGAKWFFWLTMVVLTIVFALGFNIKDAKWLNGQIASATANQMNIATDIEKQKAELDLQILRKQTELKIAEDIQAAEFKAQQQQQVLDDQAVISAQKADFRRNLYSTVNLGVTALMIALAVGVCALSINIGIGLHKILSAKAQVGQLTISSNSRANRVHHQPSSAAQLARQREQQERRRLIQMRRTNQFFKESTPIWPNDNGNSESMDPGSHYRLG